LVRCPAICDDKPRCPAIFRASLAPRAQIASHGSLREIQTAHQVSDWLSIKNLSSKIDKAKKQCQEIPPPTSGRADKQWVRIFLRRRTVV
jgi:hypothetical protein